MTSRSKNAEAHSINDMLMFYGWSHFKSKSSTTETQTVDDGPLTQTPNTHPACRPQTPNTSHRQRRKLNQTDRQIQTPNTDHAQRTETQATDGRPQTQIPNTDLKHRPHNSEHKPQTKTETQCRCGPQTTDPDKNRDCDGYIDLDVDRQTQTPNTQPNHRRRTED